MKFIYYRNTKDRVGDEHEQEVIDKAEEGKEEIDFSEFKAEVEGLDSLAGHLGCTTDQLGGDWSINFYKSTYGGLPCRIMATAECDYIFLLPADASMLAQIQSRGVSGTQWKRATSFGNGGTDPRR